MPWTRVHAVLAGILLLGLLGPGTASANPPSFDIGLIGDWGYTSEQRARLPRLVEHMNRAGLAFSVHDGDIKNGPPPCSDSVYRETRELFDRFEHPLVYTPGDNEWTDCWRSGFDPVERLAHLRRVFFSEARSRGRRPMALTQQSSRFPENARWFHRGVAFATLQVGSNNHLPNRRFRGDGKEFSARNAAVLGWLRQTFRLARERGSTGVMLAMQGDPWYESPDQRTGYHDLLRAMEEEVGRFRRPVLLVHGDTHSYRLDQPLVDSRTGRPLPNFTRVETFGPHDLAWVRVTVDPGRPGIFRIRPERVESHPRP